MSEEQIHLIWAGQDPEAGRGGRQVVAVLRPLQLCPSIRGAPKAEAETAESHRITESQNSRGWKGPLWVI